MSESFSAVLDRPPTTEIERTAADTIVAVEHFLREQAASSEAIVGIDGIAAAAGMRFAVGDTSEHKIDDAAELSEDLRREKYNRSLRALRALGRMALSGQLQTEAGRAARENVRRDLDTSLAEMFENDEAFQRSFEISVIYDYQVIDGKVYYKTADGMESMVNVTENGAAVSAAAAEVDPLMRPQARRDRADVENARRVDEIASGRSGVNTRVVVSRDLGNIIKPGSPYRKLYRDKGYREGLAFLQLYFAQGDTLTAGTFSIDGVSDDVIDEVLRENGAELPVWDDENRHDSVMYGVERHFDSKEEAIAFARRFREECYRRQGDRRIGFSAMQFIENHRAEIDRYIDALIVPLSAAIHSGRKNAVIHSFVGNLLRRPGGMSTEAARQLQNIYNTTFFTDDDGRFMSGIALYAIAEALYEDAKRFVKGVAPPIRQHIASTDLGTPLPPEQIDFINSQLVGNVHTGVAAGRQHKGPCPGSVSLSDQSGYIENSMNSQGAFGGREGENKESISIGDDKYGSRIFKCPNKSCRRENIRRFNELLTYCQHCHKKIPKC